MKYIKKSRHAALVACTALLGGALYAGNALAQELTKPDTPAIELLEELPKTEAAPSDLAPDTTTALPAAPATTEDLENLRPRTDKLGGQDPSAGQSRPGYLKTVPGMDDGVQITRITDSESFGFHSYSKRQAWNIDETMINIGGKILDTKNNYSLIHSLNMSSENQWSFTNPNLILGIKFDPKATHFVTYDIKAKKETFIYNFEGYENCTLGDYEGSSSMDDRYVVIVCKNSSGDKDIISFDIVDRKILGTKRAEWDFNWAMYTLSGEYLLVENNNPGSSDREIIRYDRSLQNGTQIVTETQHGDVGFDVNGDDVYVMIDWDYLFYVRIKDGARVNLGITNRAGNGHVSCKAYKRPGWCYFSTRDQHQRIFAAKIGIEPGSSLITDDRGRQAYPGIAVMEMWGFSKATSSTYENHPKASVSPSGKRIVYSSDWWGDLNPHAPHPGGGGDANEYVLELVE